MKIRDLVAFVIVWVVAAPAWAGPSDASIEGRVESLRDRCVEATDAETLEVDREDWCKVRSWAALGEQYPSAARELERLAAKSDRQQSTIEDLKAALGEERGRVQHLEVKLDRTEEARDRWRTLGAVSTVGFTVTAGVVVAIVTGAIEVPR